MSAPQQAAHEFVGALHDEGIGQHQEQMGCGQGSGAQQGLKFLDKVFHGASADMTVEFTVTADGYVT
jgi:hypothetical protein